MCMKYINVNVQCFAKGSIGAWNNSDFSKMISSVKAKDKDSSIIVDGFDIAVFINVRGTQSGTNTNNALDMKRKLHFRVRLTKLDSDKSKQLSYDLKDFSVDLSDRNIVQKACFEYIDLVQALRVNNLQLEEKGNYVIKILLKDDTMDLYDVQMVHPIVIE